MNPGVDWYLVLPDTNIINLQRPPRAAAYDELHEVTIKNLVGAHNSWRREIVGRSGRWVRGSVGRIRLAYNSFAVEVPGNLTLLP